MAPRPPLQLPPPDKPRKPKKKYPAPKGYKGGWADKPGLSTKKFKTIRTGKGYYIAKPLKAKPPKPKPRPKPKSAAAPKPVPGPYDEYKTTAPWAIPLLTGLDKGEQHHLGFVTGQVMPWLSQGLANLTGVNPAQPGYNPTIQQQYQANVQGSVGGAFDAAAAATPMQVAPTTPGASMAAPNAYQGAAMQEASRQRGGAAISMAQAQSALNTMQPNIYAQAAMRSVADYAAGLPGVYVTKRNELRAKIDQFVMESQAAAAELAEEQRHNKVQEAISGMNAQTNAAIQFGRLGLSADELGIEQAQAAQEANAPVPYGYVRAPDGSIKRDPTVPQATAGGSSGGGSAAAPSPAKGQYPPNKLRKEGFTGGWRKKPKGIKGPFVRATDGTWWVKPKGASGGGSSPGASTVTELQEELRKLYKPGESGGWEELYTDNPKGAGAAIARWVRENKPAFAKSGRKVDVAKLKQVLARVGGRPAAEALSILTRGYMTSDGRWK